MVGVGARGGSAVAEGPSIVRRRRGRRTGVRGGAGVDQMHEARQNLVGIREEQRVAGKRSSAATATAGRTQHKGAVDGHHRAGIWAVAEGVAEGGPVAVRGGQYQGAGDARKQQRIPEVAVGRGDQLRGNGHSGRAGRGRRGQGYGMARDGVAGRIRDGPDDQGENVLGTGGKSGQHKQQAKQSFIHELKVPTTKTGMELSVHLRRCAA